MVQSVTLGFMYFVIVNDCKMYETQGHRLYHVISYIYIIFEYAVDVKPRCKTYFAKICLSSLPPPKCFLYLLWVRSFTHQVKNYCIIM